MIEISTAARPLARTCPAFKLQADQEEQKNQPDLGNDREDLHEHRIGQGGVEAGQGRPEERGEEIGGEPPEKRRAEQEAGRDLADHARLLEAASHRAKEQRRRDDDRQLKENGQQ